MAFSFVDYTSTGTGPFSYSGIALLNDNRVPEQSQLVVTVNGTEQTYAASSPGAGEYTLNKTTKEVTLGTALVSGDLLRIQRVTERDELLVDFNDGSPISAADMDVAQLQMLYLIQESLDEAGVSDTGMLNGILQPVTEGRTYTLILYAPFATTVTAIRAKTDTGTCDLALKIEGTTVTGCDISLSTTEATGTATALNQLATGQTLTAVVDNLSGSPGEIMFTISLTRV